MALGQNLVALLFTSKQLGFMGVNYPLTLIIIGFDTTNICFLKLPHLRLTGFGRRCKDGTAPQVVCFDLRKNSCGCHGSLPDTNGRGSLPQWIHVYLVFEVYVYMYMYIYIYIYLLMCILGIGTGLDEWTTATSTTTATNAVQGDPPDVVLQRPALADHMWSNQGSLQKMSGLNAMPG